MLSVQTSLMQEFYNNYRFYFMHTDKLILKIVNSTVSTLADELPWRAMSHNLKPVLTWSHSNKQWE